MPSKEQEPHKKQTDTTSKTPSPTDMMNIYAHLALKPTNRGTSVFDTHDTVGSMAPHFLEMFGSKTDFTFNSLEGLPVPAFASNATALDYLKSQESIQMARLDSQPSIEKAVHLPATSGSSIGKTLATINQIFLDGLPPSNQNLKREESANDSDSEYDTPSTASDYSEEEEVRPRKRRKPSTTTRGSTVATAKTTTASSAGDEGLELTDLDVICQRGALTNHHPGNNRYLSVVEGHKAEYQATSIKRKKTAISEKVIEAVHEYGGRFIRKDEIGNWFEVSMKDVKTKVSQALREENSAESRALKRQKYPKKRKYR